MNKRFEQLAEEEREKNRPREDYRGPPQPVNSRFAAAAEADRSTYRERDERGPPPVANSRFAAAAEADRSTFRDERGPPPVANSRFAAAAEADRSYPPEDHGRGPSRFDQDGPYSRNDGPPPHQNSRFAAAAAADRDYTERNDRERYDRDTTFGRGDGFGRRGDDRRPRGDYDGYGGRDERQYDRQEEPPMKSSVADILKPKGRPAEENILKVPTKEHADNILQFPTKDTEKEEPESTPAPEPAPEPTPAVDIEKVVDNSEVIAAFISGERLGEDLKSWCDGQVISSVEKLVNTLLHEKEKLNPDTECAWAEPSKYGSALVSMVEDDLLKQVEVLFAIQKYCDKLGMPKLNDEYVVQAMFRSMYKYDLATDDAFFMWKEDESSENEAGKLNAVIQTVDWFNWLEEDDDDEDDYEEE